MELIEADLAISIIIYHPNHLIDFFICDVLAKGIQDESDFSSANVPVSGHIKCEKCITNLIITEWLNMC